MGSWVRTERLVVLAATALLSACGKVDRSAHFDDPSSGGKELDYYREIAQGLGCNVPDSMWRAAYQDREFNVVNKVVFYSSTGAVVEPY